MSGAGTRAGPSADPRHEHVGAAWREAVHVSGGDALVRYYLSPAQVRDVRAGVGWWAVAHGPTPYFDRGGLLVRGDVARVGEVVESLCEQLRPHEVTVDTGVPLPFADPESGAEWAWLHTTRPLPPVPDEERVDLSPAPEAVDALLDEANPDAFVRPSDPAARAWAAIHGEHGRLLACGAVTEHAPGIPLLASVAVSPTARRRGLGAALTVALTRHLLRNHPAVSLALWSGNTVARALYDRIGFTGGHDLSTRRLG